MDKQEKEILKHLVEKEIDLIKEEGEDVIFPSLKFLESIDMYKKKLNEILKDLK